MVDQVGRVRGVAAGVEDAEFPRRMSGYGAGVPLGEPHEAVSDLPHAKGGEENEIKERGVGEGENSET